MEDKPVFEPEAKKSMSVASEDFSIDYKRIGYRALKYWYLIIFSITISLFIAYLKNRYAQRIYPVTSSIILRETEETGGGEFIYKNALIDPYRNYLNEPYILRSYPLIGKVIEDLNFEVAFYKEGNIKTSEEYGLPLKIKVLKRGVYGTMVFKVLDQYRYSLETVEQEREGVKNIFHFNDSIDFHGYKLSIYCTDSTQILSYKNIPFLVSIQDPLAITAGYVGRMRVNWAEEGSSILYLSIDGPNPKKDIDFINGLILRYQKYDLDKKNQTGERAIEFIKSQLDKISDSLKVFESQLQRFRSENSSTDFNDEARRLYTKLEPLEIEKGELLLRENYYKYLVKYINEGNKLDQIILPSSMGVTDEALSALTNDLITVQMELKLFINKEKGENPLITNKLNQIAEIKKDILEAIKTLRSTDRIKLDFLTGRISEIESQVNQLPIAQRKLVSIQRNYSLLEGLYVFLMQKMSEAGISKASNVSDIVVVNPPMQGGAITPKTSQNYLMALFLGLLIPLGSFILLEILNQKIQSKEDVERISSIPFIGGIGHNRSLDNMAVTLNPKSAVAESFRALRSNLNFFIGNRTKKVFMISSSISGEGKTFTTINLASVFALSNRATLIIGADMRKPKLFGDFKLSNSRGLSGYLSGISTFDEIVQRTSIDNLDLISGGPIPPNPSELLLTDKFEMLINEALLKYDYIFIDTPPLGIVTDAFAISKYADHTIFVIRQNYTYKSLLRNIEDFYRTGKLKNTSIVLNDIYRSGLGYGYGYGSYGSYGRYGKGKNGYGYYQE